MAPAAAPSLTLEEWPEAASEVSPSSEPDGQLRPDPDGDGIIQRVAFCVPTIDAATALSLTGATAFPATASSLEPYRGAVVVVVQEDESPKARIAAINVGNRLRPVAAEVRLSPLQWVEYGASLSVGVNPSELAAQAASGGYWTQENAEAALLEANEEIAGGIDPAIPPLEKKLISIGIREFFLREVPAREVLLDPWIHQRDVGLLFAWRGVGKTLFGLSLAAAIASGGELLDWRVPKPRRCVYVDGEMPYELLREHLAAIIKAGDYEIENDYLRIVTGDIQDGTFPNLSTAEGQEQLIEAIGDAEYVALDNVACLTDGNAEGDPEDWEPVRKFQLRLRRAGIACQLTHHAGKGGDQRGHSGKEDICDWVVKLEHPADYREDQGARFAVRFTKMRKNVRTVPLEAWLKIDADGRPLWQTRPLEGFVLDKVVELSRLGRSQRQIRSDLKAEGIERSLGTVNSLLQQARREGVL